MTGHPFQYGRDRVISYPVTYAGVRTRVVESGAAGDVLVCLHGVGSRADRFVTVTPGLVDAGFRVLAIDFPGHGLADKPADFDYRPSGLATFIIGVLDELGLQSVTLVGTSLGGQVAATIASDRPDLVSRLVLIGTMGIAPLDPADMVPPENVANGSVDAVRAKLSFLVSDPAMVTDAWIREESMINSSTGAREALLRAATALNAEAVSDLQAERLMATRPGLPVLLVWGENDRWTPLEMGHRAHAMLPDAEFALMADCGHAPYFENPDEFVKRVRDFAVQGVRTHG